MSPKVQHKVCHVRSWTKYPSLPILQQRSNPRPQSDEKYTKARSALQLHAIYSKEAALLKTVLLTSSLPLCNAATKKPHAASGSSALNPLLSARNSRISASRLSASHLRLQRWNTIARCRSRCLRHALLIAHSANNTNAAPTAAETTMKIPPPACEMRAEDSGRQKRGSKGRGRYETPAFTRTWHIAYFKYATVGDTLPHQPRKTRSPSLARPISPIVVTYCSHLRLPVDNREEHATFKRRRKQSLRRAASDDRTSKGKSTCSGRGIVVGTPVASPTHVVSPRDNRKHTVKCSSPPSWRATYT